MLDEFDSNEANDYIGGFPAHPHRGFETVTYMLDGHMLHEDHMGNRGDLKPGGAQWMTAARGIIHSEMPQQVAGRMRGFQLWLNLPSHLKMQPANYRDIEPEDIPEFRLKKSTIKLIAGQLLHNDEQWIGAVTGKATDPIYADVIMGNADLVSLAIPDSHKALIYIYEGSLEIGETRLIKGELAELSPGDAVELAAGAHGARLLLLAAKPINEPIVHYGPFVMNTAQEIEQAVMDFRQGRLTA
jgi:redox-sensitive bicupin YhaK (pirin superfamily)